MAATPIGKDMVAALFTDSDKTALHDLRISKTQSLHWHEIDGDVEAIYVLRCLVLLSRFGLRIGMLAANEPMLPDRHATADSHWRPSLRDVRFQAKVHASITI